MNPVLKTYLIKVVREAGKEPLSGAFYEYTEQEFEVDASSMKSAYQLSYLVCDIPFRGQIRRTLINGEEYFNEEF
ncbi:hypothetical protein [Spirosoma aerophilum]